MITYKKLIFFSLIVSILLSNCATIFKGYKHKVTIANEKIDIEIFNEDSIKLPVFCDSSDFVTSKFNPNTEKWEMSRTYRLFIELRSKEKHILTINSKGDSKQIVLYPKVGIGWVFLDIVTGVFPLVVDLYTGNLNHFDNIIEPEVVSW